MICQNEIIEQQSKVLESKIENEQNDFIKSTGMKLSEKLGGVTTRTKISGIYKIVNKLNGKYYVGSTNHFWNRWRQHRYSLNRNKSNSKHLQYAWNKYGETAFDFAVIEKIPEESLLLIEQKYLDIAKIEQDKCYNTNFLAEKVVFTAEMRKKASDLRIGKPLSDEHKMNVKIATIKAMDKIRKQFIDKAVYTFHNTVTGESFTGTRFDFYSKYKLRKSQQMRLSALVRGKRKHVAKWGLTSINHNI